MTKEELMKVSRKKSQLCSDLVPLVKAIIPVLKDHNLKQTVSPLEEKIFEIDALQDELMREMDKNPKETMIAMLEMLKK